MFCLIGIGGSTRAAPCHTTRHAGRTGFLASDAMPCQESYLLAFLLVRPFVGVLTTTASADFSPVLRRCPFRHGRELPGKNAILPRTTVGSARLRLDHESFAVMCLLALLHRASYPILVHRLTGSFRASSHARSPSRSCTSFRSLWSAPGGLSPPRSRPCWASHSPRSKGRGGCQAT